jgi:hypothetical protein
MIPDGADVMWGQKAEGTWLLLGKSSYVSYTQASGLLFSRQTAVEWSRRRAISTLLLPGDLWSPETDQQQCTAADPLVSAPQIEAI